MILHRLRLHPFAGIPYREIRFSPGLNVILGPNEAGKSTLRRALRQVFLVPAKLNQREAREEVLPFLPLGGGDTLRVSVEFESGGGLWRLSKQWAAGNSSASLTRPDGAIVTDSSAVEERLGELLGLTRGTWDHVLFAPQGAVDHSLDRLGEGTDLAELSGRLRRAVFETDGVSLEKLGELLDDRAKEAFGRWDRERNRPEGNRGLDQRWSRGAGSIVNAWYDREQARADLEEAESYYRRLDEINAGLEAARNTRDTLAAWIAAHEAAARDAGERGRIEAELAAAAARANLARQVSQEWPVAESKAAELAGRAEELRGELSRLGPELAAAKAWEAAAQSRQRLESAETLAAETDAARAARDATPAIDSASIERLAAIERERERILARVEASVLKVRFAAAKAISVETRAGVAEPATRHLAAGEADRFEAGGRVVLRESEGAWELEVSSGGIDVVAEEARHRELGIEAAAGLAALGVPDLAAARQGAAARAEADQRVRLLEKQLAARLGSQTLAELASEVQATGGAAPPARSAADVAAEEARQKGELAGARRELEALRSRLESLAREHGSPDEVLDRLGDLRAEERRLTGQLAALAPLPAGFADAGAFLAAFRARRDELDAVRNGLHAIQVEKAGLEGAVPAYEPADAAERFGLASAAFDRARREGEALERIQRDYDRLRDELDADTLGPWQRHLGEVLAPLTAGRYAGLSPDGDAASRGDGLSIPFAALSAGARASLGLAVRLSMARWFLEGHGGFLLLDDPLVDLDPERQAAAAGMLRAFAAEKQVVVFTCHPAHAEGLGGTVVRM